MNTILIGLSVSGVALIVFFYWLASSAMNEKEKNDKIYEDSYKQRIKKGD